MVIKERLMADLKTAMRGQNVVRRDAIRMARAAVLNFEKAQLRDATEDEVIAILTHEVKQRNESIEMFRQGKREDLVAEEQAQLAILEEYLPRQLGREEIEETLRSVIAETGATGPQQLGAVMREAMGRLKGQADGRVVNQVAREMLSR
jgi:uncharacterized protein YqeY